MIFESVNEIIETFEFSSDKVRSRLSNLIEEKKYSAFTSKYFLDKDIQFLGKNHYEIFKFEYFDAYKYVFYEEIFERALNLKIIDYEHFQYFMERVNAIINNIYEEIYMSDFKQFSILIILYIFKKPLPKVKLQKLYFILVKPTIFIKTLRIFDQLQKSKKMQKHYSSQLTLFPNIPFIKNYQGPHDPMLNFILESLESNNLIQRLYQKNSELSKITSQGKEFVENEMESKGWIKWIITDVKELYRRFRNSSGSELEEFLKENILTDFNKFNRGEFLWY